MHSDTHPASGTDFELAVKEEPAMDDAFEVSLRRSGRTVTVAAGETILETLIEEGVDVVYSCMAGHCGTCETRVIEGTPDHRDSFLGDEERSDNKVMMICCSRSKTPVLVLDL
jgi:vanillate O-demethylase ferredoxin subunit